MKSSSMIPRRQLSDYYTFAPELLGFPISTTSEEENSSDMLNNHSMVPYMSTSSHDTSWAVPDCTVGPALSGTDTGFCDLANLSYNNDQVVEPGDQEISSVLMGTNYLWPAYYDQVAPDNWGLQDKQVPNIEEPEVKVGRYSVEERKGRIMRYLKKRNQRNFNKTIKYACRKTLADKRVRVRGRFAKNNERFEDENVTMNKTSDYDHRSIGLGENVSFCDDSLQMISINDEDWLQAAMAGLLYLPYIST